MAADPEEPAEVIDATAAPPDGAGKTWSPHLELASRARALWRDLSWGEASGSLGDLGTFLPLLVGLTVESGLDVGTTLIATGVYNLVTAMCFDVPMPVQPMKTIAAVALSDETVTVPQIVAAGAFVSAVVFVLGLTGLIDAFNRIVPRAVVHGMQIGLGTTLCVKAFTMAVFDDGGDARAFLGADGLLVAAAALAALALGGARSASVRRACPRRDDGEDGEDDARRLRKRGGRNDVENAADAEPSCARDADDVGGVEGDAEGRAPEDVGRASAASARRSGLGFRMFHFRSKASSSTESAPATPPTALALVLAGLAISATRPGSLSSLRVGPTTPAPVTLAAGDVAAGILKAGLPQLPLTTLNSVVAVCALSEELFPDRPASPRRVATSVGAMNLAGAAAGVMPCCHGAGGLAAHYHFGARRGAATAFLGLLKLCLGVLFGGSLFSLLRAFPKTVLGVMLGAASLELVRAAVGAFLGSRAPRARNTPVPGAADPPPTATDGAMRATRETVPDAERRPPATALWRDPDTYALLATATATAASGNTGIGVAVGLAVALTTRVAARGRAAADAGNALKPTPQARAEGNDEPHGELGGSEARTRR